MTQPEPENEEDLLVTSGGKVLTESDIYELAREAEEGYDLDKLRPRRPPGPAHHDRPA